VIALNGFENDACVPTVDFEYPEDGDAEPVIARDRWTDTPLYEKCQRRFAVVPRDRDETLPMLEMRLTVLRYAIIEAAARTDFAAVARLSLKAQSTTRRIEAETLRYGHPGGSERHGDILIVDDAGRGKVIIHFSLMLTAQGKRWVKVCGFNSGGDGATFWRVRTFRRGENTSLESARLCVREIAQMAGKEAA